MSIAGERMSAMERRAVAESLLVDPRPFKETEIAAHCPFHVERTPGGAFYYDTERDLAYCHSCGQSSDLAGIFNAVNGRDPMDADGCREFVETYCPGDGSRPIPRQQNRPAPPRQWVSGEMSLPPALWQKKAGDFVRHAVDRLQASPERLQELSEYGIDADTAKVCLIGWNDKDKYPSVTSWGLPAATNEQGKPARVWLPEGLVLPAMRDGHVVKLKVRRPNPMTPWGEKRKYWEVKGGANRLFHVYGRATFSVWVLVETERDAALVWSRCHDLGIGGIGTGGATKKPCGFVTDVLRRAKVVLNALDYDPAGSKPTYQFWEQEFPNSIRYPAPPSLGKDVGDAFKAGLDVRQWVLDGLPGYVRRALEKTAKPGIAGQASRPEPNMESRLTMALAELSSWPRWRGELAAFFEDLAGTKFKLLVGKDGRVQMGLQGGDWQSLNADEARKRAFVELRDRLHARRVLDESMGEQSLQEVVEVYFADILEVR